MELTKIWRTNSNIRGFVAEKVGGGYSVAIAGYPGFGGGRLEEGALVIAAAARHPPSLNLGDSSCDKELSDVQFGHCNIYVQLHEPIILDGSFMVEAVDAFVSFCKLN
ncbi:unnamed protein product [Fraxinus pennsylvanica]|uniref:Uncharacterized protein n=1 Tax=Fraxinus pennsylvanica TaxID=56036 RepID=A0AAD2EG61_9LAMI|nr:unnamed protein product [Fraxinus pennsylvanica]